MTSRRLHTPLLIFAIVLGLASGGCGTDKKGNSSALTRAVETLGEAKTLRSELSIDLSGTVAGGVKSDLAVKANMVVDRRDRKLVKSQTVIDLKSPKRDDRLIVTRFGIRSYVQLGRSAYEIDPAASTLGRQVARTFDPDAAERVLLELASASGGAERQSVNANGGELDRYTADLQPRTFVDRIVSKMRTELPVSSLLPGIAIDPKLLRSELTAVTATFELSKPDGRLRRVEVLARTKAGSYAFDFNVTSFDSPVTITVPTNVNNKPASLEGKLIDLAQALSGAGTTTGRAAHPRPKPRTQNKSRQPRRPTSQQRRTERRRVERRVLERRREIDSVRSCIKRAKGDSKKVKECTKLERPAGSPTPPVVPTGV